MSRRTLVLITILLLLLLFIFLLWWFFFRDTNDPPVAVEDAVVTLASTAVSDNVLTNDSDPDGDALTVTETPVAAPTNGTLTLVADGGFTYTPNDGFLGDDQFTYEVCDPDGACSQAVVKITVLEAPVANGDTAVTDQDTEVSGNVLGNDTPAGGLTASTTPTTPPAHGNVTIQGSGDFTYQPEPGYIGDDSFTYSACLTAALDFCDTAVVSITVGGVKANDDAFQAQLNTAVSGNVLDNDTPTGGLTVTIPLAVEPDPGSVEISSTGIFTYTPEAGFSGTDTFTYEACLTATPANCDTAVVTITVGGPNAVDDAYTTPMNTAVSANVLDNDTHPTGDTMTVDTTPVSGPSNGTLDLLAAGEFTYTPRAGFEGSDTFEYKVCDSASLCAQATVTITVGTPPPNAVADAYETLKNTELSKNVLDNDSDPNDLTLKVDPSPVDDVDHGSLSLAEDGSFTYTPDTDFVGDDQFTYKVCNSDSKCAEAVATITVTDEGTITDMHTVVRGDWLLQIARCYGTTTYAIRMENYIPNPDRIYPGQVLKIPGVGSTGPYYGPPCIQTYTVKAGDTPASIAAQYNIKLSEFMRINAIPWPNGFYVGQFIVIPKPIPDYMKP